MNEDMKQNKLIPELRFPEFEGEWVHDTINNLVAVITPPKRIPSSHYQSNGKFPIIDQSKSHYCGWTDDKEALISTDLPLIIFGDHTCIVKLAKEPFAQGADGIKILKTNDKILSEYLFHYLQYLDLRMEDYKRHYSILKDKIVLFPYYNFSEQQKIANCLSSLDSVIDGHVSRLELLREHKRGLMQQLFPREGERLPRLRFPEFEGEWEERKLGEVADKISERNRKSLLENVFTNSANDGIINQRNYFDKDIANKKNLENYFIVEEGDYVYNPRISTAAPVGPISKNKTGTKGAISPLYTVFRFKNKDNDFFEHYFKSSHWHFAVQKSSNTGARFDRMSITDAVFMDILILSPSLPEQQKIAECLSSLDNLIEAESERIDQLKLHKKGLMQKLFLTMN